MTLTILEELVRRGGVIKDTIEGTDIPVLWYTDKALVDVSNIRDDLITPLYEVQCLPQQCSVLSVIYQIWASMQNHAVDIEAVIVVYVRCLREYGISEELVREAFSLVDINTEELVSLTDVEGPLAQVCNWYAILTGSQGVRAVCVAPVQVYMLLHIVMLLLLDEEAYESLHTMVGRLEEEDIGVLTWLCGLGRVLDKDTFPARDIVCSIWDCYVKMEEAVCFVTVKGGDE